MPILNIQEKEIMISIEQADKICSYGNKEIGFIIEKKNGKFILKDIVE